MSRHLYFVCPTDNLEKLIEEKYPQENYYLTSLGNSIKFSNDFIVEINGLIEAKGIEKVTFVLSKNNHFILDGIKSKQFSKIRELKEFYAIISEKKNDCSKSYKEENIQTLITSYFLNLKIKELSLNLFNWISPKVDIDAKLYNKEKNSFSQVQIDLLEPSSLFLN